MIERLKEIDKEFDKAVETSKDLNVIGGGSTASTAGAQAASMLALALAIRGLWKDSSGTPQ